MTLSPDDLMTAVRRELAAWQATHPEATLADMEVAVEAQIDRLRTALLTEQTGTARAEDQPACPQCGTTMRVHHHASRTVILRGDAALRLNRAYIVCPACGTGLFPPG